MIGEGRGAQLARLVLLPDLEILMRRILRNVQEAVFLIELSELQLLEFAAVAVALQVVRSHHNLQDMAIDDVAESFGIPEDFHGVLVLQLLLCFLEKVRDNTGDVLAVVANFCVLRGFDSDEGGVVNPCDLPEYLGLAGARLAVNQDVGGPHCQPQLFLVHFSLPVLVPECQRHRLFRLIL